MLNLSEQIVSIYSPEKLLVLVGETASGKTALALELAHRIGGEIIGADSVQIYRGFDIGSGKPTLDELGSISHHLIDIVSPHELFDAQQFVNLVDQKISEIRARGHIPIVCGGTFLWVRALLYGLASAPPAPAALRIQIQNELKERGSNALHSELAHVDAQAALRIHPNDALRITRALEVYRYAGKPISEIQAEHGFRTSRYEAQLFAIAHSQEVLTERISTRVERMLSMGWLDEVRTLIAQGYESTKAINSVGYAQVKNFVHAGEHEHSKQSLFMLKTDIIRATRIFARRQRTWLAKANVQWLTP